MRAFYGDGWDIHRYERVLWHRRFTKRVFFIVYAGAEDKRMKSFMYTMKQTPVDTLRCILLFSRTYMCKESFCANRIKWNGIVDDAGAMYAMQPLDLSITRFFSQTSPHSSAPDRPP